MAIQSISLSRIKCLPRNKFLFRRPYRCRLFQFSAFSLIELLVAIAILGMLLAILLPSIQRTREVARRISCHSNLRQLSMGITNYINNNRVLPASGIVDTSKNVFRPQSGMMFSWIVQILPYIEESSLFNQINFSKDIFSQTNNPQAVHISTLICPSDSAMGKYFVDIKLTFNKQFAKGNYAAFVSPYHTEAQMMVPGALIGKRQRIEMVRDGFSHTLMLTEVRVRKNEQDQRGAWALPWNGSTLLAFDMHIGPKSPGHAYTANNSSLGTTQLPNNLGPNVDVLYSCPDIEGAQAERMPCGLYDLSGVLNYLTAAPRSNHSGGVNVAFMDGHLGFLQNEVDETAMAYMISINDGYAVNVSEYAQ